VKIMFKEIWPVNENAHTNVQAIPCHWDNEVHAHKLQF